VGASALLSKIQPAADVQARIVGAVEQAVSQTLERIDIAIVGMAPRELSTGRAENFCVTAGSIATSRGVAIDRRYDLPATNTGNCPTNITRPLMIGGLFGRLTLLRPQIFLS